MKWQINYLDIVTTWLDKLTLQQLKSVAKELRLLELSGHQLKLPHSRSLGKGLYELRERRFGLRLYYCFDLEQSILLLYAGDKSSQSMDIKKARTLMKQRKEIKPHE